MMRFAVSLGAAIQHVVKSKEKMVVNLEYAQGKSDNYGSPCSSDRILKRQYGRKGRRTGSVLALR